MPGVVVVDDNRDLNLCIEDVARHVAKAGFVALAPDTLSSVDGYPGNDDEGRRLQQRGDPQKLMNHFFDPIEYLQASELTTDKIGFIGCCCGGRQDQRDHVYPGTNHGFHNDPTPRYDEAATQLAWDRTLAGFQC